MWIGVYEFQHCLDVPWRVVLNECIELAKEFGGTDGHKYVNGVLNGSGARAARQRSRMPTKRLASSSREGDPPCWPICRCAAGQPLLLCFSFSSHAPASRAAGSQHEILHPRREH